MSIAIGVQMCSVNYVVKRGKMADNDVNGDSDEAQQEKSQKKAAKYDSGAADLEKVTDYAEEKEISSSEGFSCVSVFIVIDPTCLQLSTTFLSPLSLSEKFMFLCVIINRLSLFPIDLLILREF